MLEVPDAKIDWIFLSMIALCFLPEVVQKSRSQKRKKKKDRDRDSGRERDQSRERNRWTRVTWCETCMHEVPRLLGTRSWYVEIGESISWSARLHALLWETGKTNLDSTRTQTRNVYPSGHGFNLTSKWCSIGDVFYILEIIITRCAFVIPVWSNYFIPLKIKVKITRKSIKAKRCPQKSTPVRISWKEKVCTGRYITSMDWGKV